MIVDIVCPEISVEDVRCWGCEMELETAYKFFKQHATCSTRKNGQLSATNKAKAINQKIRIKKKLDKEYKKAMEERKKKNMKRVRDGRDDEPSPKRRFVDPPQPESRNETTNLDSNSGTPINSPSLPLDTRNEIDAASLDSNSTAPIDSPSPPLDANQTAGLLVSGSCQPLNSTEIGDMLDKILPLTLNIEEEKFLRGLAFTENPMDGQVY